MTGHFNRKQRTYVCFLDTHRAYNLAHDGK